MKGNGNYYASLERGSSLRRGHRDVWDFISDCFSTPRYSNQPVRSHNPHSNHPWRATYPVVHRAPSLDNCIRPRQRLSFIPISAKDKMRWSVYEVYCDPFKRTSTGNCVAVLDTGSAILTSIAPHLWDLGIAGNLPCYRGSITQGFLLRRCKQVSAKRALQVHPALVQDIQDAMS